MAPPHIVSPRTSLPRRAVLAGLGLATVALASCARPAPPPTVKLYVESDGDYLMFKPDRLSVPAGSHVVLTFHHGGTIITQDHDWVLTKPAAMKALLAESDRMAGAMESEGQSFLKPGDPRVIAATRLVKKGESATVAFTAPEPGDYPFFCSTPGHAESMTGVLHVSAR